MKTLRRQTVAFFALAYAWSWAWWVPVVFELRSEGGSGSSNVPAWIVPFVLIGAYGPSLAAVVITFFSGGRPALKTLFSRFLIWRAPIKVHVVIWFGPTVFLGIAMLLAPESAALLGDPDWTRLWQIPTVLLTGVIFGPLAEELGWRGYALPTLQKKHSALVSSLIIGLAWCFWHTPLFWAPGGTMLSGREVTVAAVAKYLVFACGLAIVFTWIFNNSRGSVLLAVAFHAVINAQLPMLLFPARDRDASQVISWLSMIPLWALALALVAVYGVAHLRKEPPAEVAHLES